MQEGQEGQREAYSEARHAGGHEHEDLGLGT